MPEPRPFVKLSELFAKFKKGGLSIDDAERQALDLVKAAEPAPLAKAALTGAAKIAADARACAEMCIECAKSCIDGAATTEWHGYSCSDAVSACVSCARYCLACAEALDVEASEKAATVELKKGLELVTGAAEKAQLLAKAAPAAAAPPPPTAAAPKEPAVPTDPKPAPPAASPQSEVEKALARVKEDLDAKLAKAQAEREAAATAQSAGHEALKKSLELQEQIRKQKADDDAQAKQLADAVAELSKKYDAEIQKVTKETEQFREIAAQATAQAQKTNALAEQLVQELAKRPKGVTKVFRVEKAEDNGTAPAAKDPVDPKDPVALVKAVHANGPSIDLTARLVASRPAD